MINAKEFKELRIGNWVKTKLNDTGFVAIDINHLVHIVKDSNYYGYQPIPLTTEILLKCGFVQDDDLEEISLDFLNNYRLLWRQNKVEIECWDTYYNFNDGASIEHLHQLQNLYYCLTGKELEIKSI